MDSTLLLELPRARTRWPMWSKDSKLQSRAVCSSLTFIEVPHYRPKREKLPRVGFSSPNAVGADIRSLSSSENV